MAPLRNRNFLLLWLGGLISMIGTWMLLAALPFYIYEVTQSAMATSGLLMAFLAPGILFGSFAGVFVDRWDRKRVLVVGNLIQALTIPLLLLVEAGGWIWLIYVVAFVESTVNQFLAPAENALLPLLVDESQLVSANSLNALNDNLARVVGAAIGGLLLGIGGFSTVVLLDALSYLLALILIAMVVAPKAAERAAAAVAAGSAWLKLWQEWVAGLRLVGRSDILRNLFIVIGVALFGDAILSALMAVFAQDVAGFTATEYGWLLTARGAGGIIGAVVVAQLGSRLSTLQRIAGGLVISGIGVLIMVLFPTLPIVLTTMVLIGPALMAWIITMQTVLQTATDDQFRGRVFGAYGTTNTLLMFIGSGLAGFFADVVGTFALLLAAAAIYVVAGLLSWLLLSAPLGERAVALDS